MEDENIHRGPFGQHVENVIEKARNGDAESARIILNWFCGAIKANTGKDGKPHRKPSGTGTQIDERILRYLGECFQKILDGGPGARVDANRALGLNSGKKGNKKTKKSRQQTLDMGRDVVMRHEEIKAERKKSIPLTGGLSPLERAIKDIAKQYSKSDQTVKDAYDEFKKTVIRGRTKEFLDFHKDILSFLNSGK